MNHNNFILSPISKYLQEAISATAGIGDGIETYPLGDYIMQSIFLKMTGSQEQKMKCIYWELATNDYAYRLTFLKDKGKGFSVYKQKSTLYKDLIEQIIKFNSDFNPTNHLNKSDILLQTTSSIQTIFKDTNLKVWSSKQYKEYETIWSSFSEVAFANDPKNLFTAMPNQPISLIDIYNDHLYRHRNRIAHNTQSYQQNLPTLKVLAEKNTNTVITSSTIQY